MKPEGSVMPMTTFATGIQTAEGPVELPDGTLLCCEVRSGQLILFAPDGSRLRSIEVGGGPNGAALGPDGRCYVCNNGGISERDIHALSKGLANKDDPPSAGCIQVVDLNDGIVSTLYDSYNGTHLSAPNDIVFDFDGGFYFTDHGNLRNPAPLPGAIYYARHDGSRLNLLDSNVERPNGIGLSPGSDMLYVSETSSGRIWQYPVLGSGNVDVNARTLLFADGSLSFDSLAVQVDGSVCVAAPPQNTILRVGNGAVDRINTPPGWPSNLCFAGKDHRLAYITSIMSGEIWLARWDAEGLALAY